MSLEKRKRGGAPRGSFDWTDERVERLKKLWADGQTSTAIMNQLGCSSRSSVLGKLYRLGLVRHAKNASADAKPKMPNKAAAARKSRPAPPDVRTRKLVPPPAPKVSPHPAAWPVPIVVATPPFVPAEAGYVDIMNLRDRHCRWPFACDDGVTRYCGGEAEESGPYCKTHATRAYVMKPTMKVYAPTKSGRGLAIQREARS